MIAAKVVPVGFISIGVFLLMQVILPVISFQLWELSHQFENRLLINPTPPKDSKVLGISIQNYNNFPSFFSTLSRSTLAKYPEFTLTVPRLKIEKSTVLVDSNDLSNNLAHLPGSALPGEKGNVFISGHSALSPLLNLKKAPFGNLTDLKKGDEIIIEAVGVKFKYRVIETKVVDPKELSIITPPEPLGRYISLMTCVPPGLNYKRLVVLGKML